MSRYAITDANSFVLREDTGDMAPAVEAGQLARLLPAGAPALPRVDSTQAVKLVNMQYVVVQALEAGVVLSIQAAAARARRDALLAASDWTQPSDVPHLQAQRAAWQVYRQLLRDVPQQAGFPGSVVWPTLPTYTPGAAVAGGMCTVAQLLQLDAVVRTGRYIYVTDLWSDVGAVGMGGLCVSEGGSWKPVRPGPGRIVANANASMTLSPFLNSPTQILQGALTANRPLALSLTGAWPGAEFEIINKTTGLFGVVVAAATSLTLPLGKWARFKVVDGSWQQTISGGLL